MIVTIHQPYYLPYLGFFHKVLKSDIFVFLDNAQYEKGNFYNRNKINTNSGEALLTVPVSLDGHQIRINEVKIQNNKWQKKHHKSIVQSYQKSPYFKEHENFLDDCYLNRTWKKLDELNIFMFKYYLEYLEVDIPIFKTSQMDIKSDKTERLKDICKNLDATTYLSGPSGKKYLDETIFKQEKIDILYQNFKHPIYKTIHKNFVPYLSILDLLMNEGKNSKKIILDSNGN